MGVWGERLRRGFRRSPGEIARRLGYEWSAQTERWRRPPAADADAEQFARLFGDRSLTGLVERVAQYPHAAWTDKIDPADYEGSCPGDAARIREFAARARRHEVNLLGSGPVGLGRQIDWQRDIRNDVAWPVSFFRDIDILDRGRSSDIKLPWELSRLQWLIPVGQSYLLGGDDEDAAAVRAVIEGWIQENPYALGANWASTMEAAMRIFAWSWFFHVFKGSVPWCNDVYRLRFLRALYQHAVFVERHVEVFGGDGNHLTADAAALCVAGGFFGGTVGDRWMAHGWEILLRLLPVQVPEDGVCFEASTGYHRLVAELYFIAVRTRARLGLEVPDWVHERLGLMGRFSAACTGPDDLVPAWGDGDDGRVLPFGRQAVLDHSYLPVLVGAGGRPSASANPELLWWNGPDAGGRDLDAAPKPGSAIFEPSGVVVLKGESDLLFADAGSVGFLGRGGHGHNDCLSIELCLDGSRLLSDSGSFVYTESPELRDRFRSTGAHSTPQIDGAEQNRFIRGEPFRLEDDVLPSISGWAPGEIVESVRLRLDGYGASDAGIPMERALILDKQQHRALVRDTFHGTGGHHFRIPFHLAPGLAVRSMDDGRWRIENGDRVFTVACLESDRWTGRLEEGDHSPSYGIRVKRPVLVFERQGGPQTCTVILSAGDVPADELTGWAAAVGEGS